MTCWDQEAHYAVALEPCRLLPPPAWEWLLVGAFYEVRNSRLVVVCSFDLREFGLSDGGGLS